MRRFALALVALTLGSGPVLAGDPDAARAEMEKALGGVPSMFQVFPDAGLAGAWDEFNSIQLSKDTALDPKTKELMGLAVASQIPCSYCIYFHTKAARANGATDEEIREAVAMAAITRHWSTVLNGMQVDEAAFRAEVDKMMGGATPPASN